MTNIEWGWRAGFLSTAEKERFKSQVWVIHQWRRVYHTEGSKSEREKQIWYTNAYMWNLKKIGIDDLIYKAEIETQM